MFGAPDVWDALMRKIAGISAAYLEVQVGAGASAVQLFDSWAGALTPRDYREHVMPHSARVLERAGALGVPRIHFGVGTSNLLGLMGEAGADVVGVDWRTPLDDAIARVGDRAVQGNLDPTLVFAPTDVMTARAGEIIEAGRAARGHVFNLGHGVLPSTDPDQLKRLTEFVQAYSLGLRRLAAGAGVRRRSERTSSRVGTPTSAEHDQPRQQRADGGGQPDGEGRQRAPAGPEPGDEPGVVVVLRRGLAFVRDLVDADDDRRQRGLVGEVAPPAARATRGPPAAARAPPRSP